MDEKRYTEYIIDGIIDGMTDAKQTRPDIDLLTQRLYEISAIIEKERSNAKINAYIAEINAYNAEIKKETGGKMDELISRQTAIDSLWKALYKYEDETEKQFQESEDLDVGEWIGHRIFVQNMNDIDRKTILNLPSIDAVKHGRWEEKEVIHYGQTIEEWQSAKCSVCGRYHTTPFTYYFKYCPNCGARMDEGDNHETN